MNKTCYCYTEAAAIVAFFLNIFELGIQIIYFILEDFKIKYCIHSFHSFIINSNPYKIF